MGAHNIFLSSLASYVEGVDGRRLALAGVVLVLALLAWRKLRDGLLMAVVFGAVLFARAGDDADPGPAAVDPAPPTDTRPALILA